MFSSLQAEQLYPNLFTPTVVTKQEERPFFEAEPIEPPVEPPMNIYDRLDKETKKGGAVSKFLGKFAI